ncbi:MAG: ROK family protein [Acidobacteriaceae bacterium]|jgi:fructokinase
MAERIRIGIDLGGTKIEGLALDEAGTELARLRIATPQHDYAATVKALVGVVADLERRVGGIRSGGSGVSAREEASVGVGIPGTVVQATGLVKNANSTWLNGQPLERDLGLALGRPVRIANDANCLAVSEATDGAAAGAGVVFAVILGTGCGGGVAVNGRVHVGPNGVGGEWGHNPLPWATEDELPGPRCYCGRFGCIETWISGTGLARDHATLHPPDSGLPLTGSEIVAAAQAGDAAAEASMVRLEDRIGRSLASLVNLLDPDVIVIGGGLSKLDRIYGNVRPVIERYLFGGGALATPVLKAKHGDASGVRGAAWLWPA